MGRGVMKGMGVALVMAALAGGAEAQQRDRQPAGYAGLAFIGGDPVGELGSYIDEGFGGQFWGALPLEPSGHLRARADFGFLIYGHERRRLCFSVPVGCRIEMDLTTTNSILFGGLGPEVVLARGAVEPYLNASLGFSYFATTSSLSGERDHEDYFNTTNFSDAVFAWRAGGGIRVRVSSGRTPVSVDLGVERHQNGISDFLTKGDIIDHPDGSITLLPNRAEANLVTFRMGVSVGIPHGDKDRNDRPRKRGRRR